MGQRDLALAGATACGVDDVRAGRLLASRPRLLDLFCGQGGAGAGYDAAGFDVVGVDLVDQPRYPFRFVQADALTFLTENAGRFDAVHASVPCQAYSRSRTVQGNTHPQMIGDVRDALEGTGLPWVIENVSDAAGHLRDPVMLCASAWARRTYRHRLFESNVPLPDGPGCRHQGRQAKMGRPAADGEALVLVGHFPQVDLARRAMGMPWASRDGIAQAILPVYADWVGRQLMASIYDAEAVQRGSEICSG